MKIMLDTNAFDFIYENNLIDVVNSFVDKGKIKLYVTHVQSDELEKIKDPVKKEQVKKIQCIQLLTSFGVIGIKSERGFEGGKIGLMRIAGDEKPEKIEKVQSTSSKTHPLGNTADVTIVDTATDEEMDYLVSNDTDILQIGEKLESNVKIISCADFHGILKQLNN